MANIDNDIYNRVAPTWWDEDGFMAILRTSLNPPRAAYFRNVIVQRMGLQPSGLQVLDVGCGGGLLSEEFAALRCQVTGIDPSEPTLQAAREHARKGGLNIRYLSGRGEALPFEDRSFDLVCCCDVFEHVEDLDAVLREIGRVLKPGGVLLFDTINRTLRSKLVAIKLAQDWPPTRFIPADVHVWEKFIRPQELQERCRTKGWSVANSPACRRGSTRSACCWRCGGPSWAACPLPNSGGGCGYGKAATCRSPIWALPYVAWRRASDVARMQSGGCSCRGHISPDCIRATL